MVMNYDQYLDSCISEYHKKQEEAFWQSLDSIEHFSDDEKLSMIDELEYCYTDNQTVAIRALETLANDDNQEVAEKASEILELIF